MKKTRALLIIMILFACLCPLHIYRDMKKGRGYSVRETCYSE